MPLLPSCFLPLESGPCQALFPAYGFDPATARCEPFTYGGCGGNANRFENLEACDAACTRTFPESCATSSPRQPGCPCTSPDQCNCSSAEFELGGDCRVSDVGLCDESVSEGNCICLLDGQRVCGV
jgi:hypothetical protein